MRFEKLLMILPVLLLTCPVLAQNQFQLPPGLGSSFITNTGACLDRDGDGYGVGPACQGLDADDNDPSVQTAAQGITKYGSLAAFLTKLGNDNDTGDAGVAAGYSSPNHTWFLAPANATPAGSDSNACNSASAPCLTFTKLVTAGMTGGDLILLRNQWNGHVSVFNGTSSKFTVVMSYPGEQAVISGASGNAVDLTSAHHVVIDGLKIQNGSQISGGTPDGAGSNQFTHVLLKHIDGGAGGTGIGPVAIFNGLSFFTVEDSVFHDNSCAGGACQHGMYNGSRELPSDHVTYQRLIAYGNDYNGLTFNGRCNSCTFTQLVTYNNLISGLTFEEGVNNSVISDVLAFNNTKQINFFNYSGQGYVDGGSGSATVNTNGTNVTWVSSFDGSTFTSGAEPAGIGISINCQWYSVAQVVDAHHLILNQSAGIQNNVVYYQAPPICPYDQTGNVIENVTLYSTQHLRDGSDNTGGQAFQISNVNPGAAQNMGGNTYRNIIAVNWGSNNHYSPFEYFDCNGLGDGQGCSVPLCGAACQGYLQHDTFDHVISFQTDGNNGNGLIAACTSPTCNNFGFASYTCAQATAAFGTTTSNCSSGDPKFVSASPNFWNSVGSFDFHLQNTSPAAGHGVSTALPAADLNGVTWLSPPAMGALELASATGLPRVTSPTTATGQIGAAFSYQITATNGPLTGFGATGLPNNIGLSFNSTTGVISGTPTNNAAGTYQLSLTASNSIGTSSSYTLTLTINPPAPVINSATSPGGTVGIAFSYTITGTNNPASFGETGTLPNGLSFNSTTGVISGTPAANSSGTYPITISATNGGGTGNANITITILPVLVPVITSSLTASAVVGTPFSYTITASNAPILLFGASGLPNGFSINTTTGVISGTANSTSGSPFNVTLSATNVIGQSQSATLVLTIFPPNSPVLGWAELPNTLLKNVCPSNTLVDGTGSSYQFSSFCSKVVGAWSGAVADTKRDRLVIWGGGHGDYDGNEIYSLNLAPLLTNNAPTLTRLDDPSPIDLINKSGTITDTLTGLSITDGCPIALSDGRPNSRHSELNLEYIAHLDRMFVFDGALACGNGSHKNDTWTLDMTSVSANTNNTPNWQRMDPVNGSPVPFTSFGPWEAIAAYDPNLKVVWVNWSGTLWKYTYENNTWTCVAGSTGCTFPQSNDNVPFEATGVIDPHRGLFIFMGSGFQDPNYTPHVMAIDITPGSNYAVQDWSSQVTGCGSASSNPAIYGIAGASWPGLAYDPVLDRIVGWPNAGNTVYIFNPDTKSCTTQTFPNGPQNAVPDITGQTSVFGRFRYFRDLNAYALVSQYDLDAFLLRLNLTAASTDVTPPTIAISSPAAGTVSGTVTVTANVSDNAGGSGVAGVLFKVDGTVIGAEVTSPPYSVSWNTSQLPTGAHTLEAIGRDAAGNTALAAAVTVTVNNTGDSTPPSVPSGLTATAVSSSQINLSWNASTDAESGVLKYNIYRNGSLLTFTPGNTLSFQDTGLSASTTYNYKVSAVNNALLESAQSAQASATTSASSGAAPGVPSLTSPANGATGISTSASLQWSAASNATSYTVYYGAGSGSCTSLTNASNVGNVLTYSPVLAANTLYYWCVQAVNNSGSTSSAVATFTTAASGGNNGGNNNNNGGSGGSYVPPPVNVPPTQTPVTQQQPAPPPALPSDSGLTLLAQDDGTVQTVPSSITFTGSGTSSLSRGSEPEPASRAIRLLANSGVATDWTASVVPVTGPQWLSVSPTSGQTPASLKLSANTASLPPGVYQSNVVVRFTQGSRTVTVPVFLKLVSTTTTVFDVTPSQLSFSAVAGGSSVSQPMVISDEGTVLVNWSATSSAQWLSISQGSGTSPSSLIVTANPSGLSAGSYDATVFVSANGASVSVPVHFSVASAAPAGVSLNPKTFVVDVTQGASAPAPLKVSVANSGSGAFSWRSSVTLGRGVPNWLSATPSTGSGPGNVTVSVNPTGLAPGQYQGTVDVALNGSPAVQSVWVLLNVTAAGSSTMTLSPPAVSLQTVAGGAGSLTQTVRVGTLGSAFSWSAATSTADGGNWLSVSQNSGSAPGSATVVVNSSGLAAGTYTGSVQFSANGISGSPQTVPVALVVRPAGTTPAISAEPGSLAFSGAAGGSNPSSQTVSVASLPAGNFNWVATTSVSGGGSWLSVTPSSGSGAGAVTVSANTASLAAGTYNGLVSFSSKDVDNWTVSVPVTLVVNASSGSSGVPALISFLHLPKSFEIPLGVTTPVEVAVTDSIGQPLTGASVSATFSSGESLSLAELGGGIYGARWTPPLAGPLGITVQATSGTTTIGASTSGEVISIGVDPPFVFASGVVNAATFLPSPAPIVPGSMISIFGENLSGAPQSSTQLPLPTSIGGTQVYFDSIAAPLFYASPGQINAQVPYELAGRDRTRVTVVKDGVQALSIDLRLARSAPAIFSADGSGAGPGAIVHSDGSIVSASNPARRLETLSIFATGLGAVDPAVPSGNPAPDSPAFTAALPFVMIGGVPTPVTYSGLAPGFVGLYQVNVQVPAEVPSGPAVPVTMRMGNLVSDRSTIAIQ